MLVKCKSCGNKIDREVTYKVIIKGKNQYYCNEKEYLDIEREKTSRIEVLEKVKGIIGDTTNTVLFKELSEVSKIHTYNKLLQYLVENEDNLNKSMQKPFQSEYGKIKYFTTIIKNNIGDFQVKEKSSETIYREIEFVEVNYKARERKKSLNQYMEEYLKGE